MGLLTVGEPLDWTETKKHSDTVRNIGIEQFIILSNTFKSRSSDTFKYGDEVEYSLVKVNFLTILEISLLIFLSYYVLFSFSA